jgi:hypothetical protein
MINKTTYLMAAVLAFATVLTVGLTVLPASVQEAQANPCSEGSQAAAASNQADFSERGEGNNNAAGDADQDAQANNVIECEGIFIIDEIVTVEPDPFAVTEEEEAAEEDDAEFE